MKRPTPSRPLAVAGAVAVLTAGAIAVPVVAQSGTTSTATTTATQGTTTGGTTTTAPKAGWGRGDDTQFRAALAKELGISTDKLDEAMTAARETVFLANLDDMVTDGRITKAQAQELRDAAAKGTLTETLRAQRLKELRTRLDEAVKDGRLTKAEADARYKEAQSDTGGGPGMFGGARGHGPGDMGGRGHWGP
jgi:hypothetical protein